MRVEPRVLSNANHRSLRYPVVQADRFEDANPQRSTCLCPSLHQLLELYVRMLRAFLFISVGSFIDVYENGLVIDSYQCLGTVVIECPVATLHQEN